jgi:teichuronic acid biosynthesis glycosyltransferase TuaC
VKVLFVSSGNAKEGISTIIKNQGKSLTLLNIQVDYFIIKGKGLFNYLHHIFILNKKLKACTYDIIHAHYGLSAIITTLAGAKPLVVSLMGSDVKENGWQLFLIKFWIKRRWNAAITKSPELAGLVNENKIHIIPNGVNLHLFMPIEKLKAKKKIGWDPEKKYILFGSDPKRPEKNFILAHTAFKSVNESKAVLIPLQNVPHKILPYMLNGAEVLLLSSVWEGSPNIIKEAMACNVPIVSTRVGDVDWLLDGVRGTYIADFAAADYTKKIILALQYSAENQKTNGREKIQQLGLDHLTVAQKILDLYNNVVANKKNNACNNYHL